MTTGPNGGHVRCRCGMMRSVDGPVCADCFFHPRSGGHGGRATPKGDAAAAPSQTPSAPAPNRDRDVTHSDDE